MPTAADEPGDVLSDAGGTPLAVSLRSVHALDPGLVGNGTCLLAAAGRLGLPVADGVAVTTAGVANDDRLDALRHAWRRTRGPVHVLLSDRGPRSGLGVGPSRCDASTWSGLLDGLHDLLAYDQLENPGHAEGPWAILVLKVPADGRCAIVESDHRGRIRLWAADGRRTLNWPARVRLRALARQTRERIGRPISLEAMRTEDGDWVITDLRHRVSRIARSRPAG
ncbi:hypothetical protein GA0115240_13078 [Streptomyces sp. DvalAA-14]|uniref:hypothetical protein n=1 Tax=unclassified Streptomyces TaxID=2593676 RepID=UPI00081B7236|nr:MULTISPECIES: hypothetical protein [unclassified Streptomyces]MYS21432.1 hypothetical protein [Streptomyces sp. SID4948]SCD92533.1 hypothetical protein GA0115240_13078 [Streptomyces sp. DvalAA-14]